MKNLLATTAIAALGAASAATAQDILDLGEITVTANRAGGETALSRTGATVEVITAEDLARAADTTVADYLATLPGVSVSTDGGLGATGSLRIRGLDGKYIKVLVDGIDVTDPSAAQTTFNWGGLTTAGIDRIELLKGSSSSLYGSRAIAGVISITTDQRPEEPGTEVTLTAEGGSFGTYSGGATLAGTTERGGYTFSLNRVSTDGFSARAGAGNDEPDGYEATQFTFSADIQATDTLVLGASGLALNSSGDFDEFGGDGAPPYDETATTQARGLRGWAELTTGAVVNTVSASYFQNDRVSSSNGFDTAFTGERRRIDYIGEYVRSEALSLSFGADWERESYLSGAEDAEADTAGVFGEVLYAPNADLDLAASLRYDDHSEFGGNLSGRLAAAWRASDATILRAVAATGFRAPSLYELNSAFYGNKDLQPETSVSFELGVEQQLGGGSFVRATGFYTEIDDLIQFVTLTSWPDPFTGQFQQVPGTSTSKGVELSGEWVLSNAVTLVGAYTYTDATDAEGAPLLRVPGHDLVLGVTADFTEAFSGGLTAQYIADRPDEFGTEMPDFTVVNATLSYAVTDAAEIYLRIQNLLDEDYQTSAGYNAAGRAAYAGIRATF
ncbi:MAG: TonB-dependent receptor [Sedimentitalea sp.]|nr:TonB-dependent receptor [Sedimentitalea sp.]